jgi:hypothetical protein
MFRHLSESDLKTLIAKRDRDYIEKPVRAGRSLQGKSKRVVPYGVSAAPSPLYRSKWETQFAYELVLRQRTNLIRGWAYEDMTFKLATGKYHRPDFTIWHLDGSIEIAQVKGYHKNIRASLTALKWAAQQRPWFLFTLNRRDGARWVSEVIRS